MWTVLIEFVEEWLLSLDVDTYDQVSAALDVLAAEGPTLGRPLVDKVHGSRFHNMKELRPGSAGRTEVRILFIFDPDRNAILLIGGDKSRSWDRWYRRAIQTADDTYARYLEER